MPAQQQTGFEDLGFTPEQSGGFEDLGFVLDGAPKVSNVPSVATLRARHAVNTAAGQEAYKPGWLESATMLGPNGVQDELLRGAKNAIVNTPQRIGHALSGLGSMASELVDPAAYKGVTDNPIVNLPGKIGAGLVTGLTEPLMSPSTTGEAATGGLIDTAVGMGAAKGVVKGAKAVASIPTAWKTYQGAQVGNRLKAGLGISPTDARALSAIDESLGTLRGGTKAKVPFTNSQSMADFVSGHNKKFFDTHHESLAEINRTLPVEFMGESTTLDKVLAERSRLNKRLHNYQSQDPKTRAIMEEVNPSIKADAERLQASREAINGALDTVAPQSSSQADILRTFSHLKELEDITSTRAAELKAIKQIAKGSKLPMSEVAKDFVMNKVTLGMAPGAQIPSRVLLSLRNRLQGPRIDPDKLIRIAGRKFKHVQAADPITPEPMTSPNQGVRIEQPGGQMTYGPGKPSGPVVTANEAASARAAREAALTGEGLSPDEVSLRMRTEALPTEGQTFMPFVQPGVGAVGHELPQVPGAPRAIQVPNSLTQQFNRMPPEDAIAPVSGNEAVSAYQSRQQSLFEQNPQMTPGQLTEAMRSQSVPGQGQDFLPLVPPQIGDVPGNVFPPKPAKPRIRVQAGRMPAPQISEVPRPTIGGKQLQPYTGPERRGPGATGHEQRLGYRAAQSAAADPAVAQRAVQLHEAISGPGGTSADLDELARLQEQYDWIGNYLAYGRNPVQRGGTRR